MGKFIFTIIFILIFVMFLFRATIFLDPDFGWHLRTGQIILTSGIPKTDPFSYTMPSFPYVDHSWLSDVITACLYPHGGMVAIGLITAILVFLSLCVATSIRKNKSRVLLSGFILLSTAALLPFASTRPLVWSWLLFTIFLWILSDVKRWQKFRFLAPVLLLLGANLHGGFISYLVLLAIFLFCRFLRRSLSLFDLLIAAVCIVITLINPYGLGLWREVLSTVFSSALKENIAEWKSSFEWFNPAAITMGVTGLIFSIRYLKKYPLFNVLAFWFFIVFSITQIRNIPFLVFTSLPILFLGFKFLEDEAKDKSRLILATKVFAVLSVIVFAAQTILIVPEVLKFNDSDFYPGHAVEFLHQNSFSGQIFSVYDWGGFLIWKLPEKKVFIDGRMPVWVRVPPNKLESTNAFGDYLQIISGKKDYQSIFSKFNIKTVLLPKLPKTGKTFVKILDSQNSFNFYTTLEKAGWKKTYEDQTAVIYVLK